MRVHLLYITTERPTISTSNSHDKGRRLYARLSLEIAGWRISVHELLAMDNTSRVALSENIQQRGLDELDEHFSTS
jgi:flagellar motor switch/type III secretory pathway protein FliN